MQPFFGLSWALEIPSWYRRRRWQGSGTMGFLEDYPDLEAGVTPSAVHPVTGAFAEPSHETAFAAQLFRTAFPCHVVLLALTYKVAQSQRRDRASRYEP